MPRRGKRKTLARCIYQDSSGRSGIYRDGLGKPREVRFPPFTPLDRIRKELDRLQAQARGSGRAQSARGTLAEAVDTWDTLERHLVSWKHRRAELRAWVRLYGQRPIHGLEEQDVRRAMSTWATCCQFCDQPADAHKDTKCPNRAFRSVSPKTIRNRLWTLRHLFQLLYGPECETPCDHVKPPARVRTVINPTPDNVILTVYENLVEQERKGFLRDAKTRARFMVRASTGRRPIEIMRALPGDVDLGNRVWRVRDAKGGWSEGIYLNDDMLVAWMLFAQSKAWGYFDTHAFARVLRTAGWPEDTRPYNLRHSMGIMLSEQGHDLADVGAWLGHTDPRTTRSAYVPVLNSRMTRMARSVDGRFSGWNVARDGTDPDKSTT